MCGIVGVWRETADFDVNIFNSMVDTLASRGPDGRGVKILANGRVYLGHRRLSIIDLSNAGSQPMCNEDGSVWLTYNGELYNFKTLRDSLQNKGHQFKSLSDSEVIVHAYEEWGENCLTYFRGIFSFALWDDNKNTFFLARDPMGVKPLYYYSDDKQFIFASEPRAIIQADGFVKKIDQHSFSLYLAYGNVPGEHCIYEGIKKLLPAHFLKLENNKVIIKQYWQLNYDPIINDSFEAERELRIKIEECVKLQSVSDVPVGTLLSGGIDSTIITAILGDSKKNDISTFTVGFEEKESDESVYARTVANALASRHHEQILNYSKACLLIPDIISAFDEPFHLNGLFPFMALSRFVQSNKYKVMLGGDGADELFAGYLWYEQFLKKQTVVSNRSALNYLQNVFKKTLGRTQCPTENFFPYNGYFNPRLQQKLLGGGAKDINFSNIYHVLNQHWREDLPVVLAAQLLDFNCFMQDHCLVKVDRASMASGVEVRVPFLDAELVELVFSINHNIIFEADQRKSLLKRAMKNAFPVNMDTMRKKGFSSPLKHWLQMGLTKAGNDLIIRGRLCESGLLDADFLNHHYQNMTSANQLLLISVELWFRQWIDNDPLSIEQFAFESCKHFPRQ